MPIRIPLVAVTTGLVLAGAPSAHAQLPVPDPTGGLAGQVLGQVPAPVSSLLDSVLATGQGVLDPAALDGLLGPQPARAGVAAPGSSGAAGAVLAPGGVIDGRAPTATLKVLSHLRTVRKTGRLVVQVGSSEPSLVALGGTIRPGRPLARRRARTASFRSPIHFPKVMLTFRRAGTLRVTIAVSRSAQKRLGRARDARLSMALLAVDASRNQATRQLKRHVSR